MSLLKEMVEKLVNEKTEDAQIIFHKYLNGKLSSLVETKDGMEYSKVKIANEKVSEFVEEAEKLFTKIEIKVKEAGEFYTEVCAECKEECKEELKQFENFAEDFKG